MNIDFGTMQVVQHAKGSTNKGAKPAVSRDVKCTPRQLPSSTTCPVPSIVSYPAAQNPTLVSKGIGTYLEFEHQIQLVPDAVPMAVKVRPVPYMIEEKVADVV